MAIKTFVPFVKGANVSDLEFSLTEINSFRLTFLNSFRRRWHRSGVREISHQFVENLNAK